MTVKTERIGSLQRRQLITAGAAGVTLGALGLAGCATTASGPSIGRVVVIGGGFGGATAARYLKMWGGNVDVTLIDRNDSFISCPISNLVIEGRKQLSDITVGYGSLERMGVRRVRGEVTAIDAQGRKVRLADGSELPYDRLVLSPGVDFLTDQVGGLAGAGDQILHAWKAGPQSMLS